MSLSEPILRDREFCSRLGLLPPGLDRSEAEADASADGLIITAEHQADMAIDAEDERADSCFAANVALPVIIFDEPGVVVGADDADFGPDMRSSPFVVLEISAPAGIEPGPAKAEHGLHEHIGLFW